MFTSILLSLVAATYIAIPPPPVSTDVSPEAAKPVCKCSEPKPEAVYAEVPPVPEVPPVSEVETEVPPVPVPEPVVEEVPVEENSPIDAVKSTITEPITETIPDAPEGYLPYKIVVESESGPYASDIMASSSESLKWSLPLLVAASILL